MDGMGMAGRSTHQIERLQIDQLHRLAGLTGGLRLLIID